MSTVSEPIAAELFVTLRGGLTVRVEAIRLLLELEARGVRVERDGGDIVLCPPAFQVTDDDRRALRQHKPDVLEVLRYVDEAVQ